jgi:ribosomal protein L35
MPKLKTKKSVVKKVKVTSKRKVTRRYTKQNHYNSRQNGNFKRKKRGTLELFKTDEANVLKALPYA